MRSSGQQASCPSGIRAQRASSLMEVLSPKAAVRESPKAAQLCSDAASKPLLVQAGAGGPTVACKGAILCYSKRM